MSEQELTKRLIMFISQTKSYKLCEGIITERKLLDYCITEEKRKGRIVTLPFSKCNRARCDIYESKNPNSDYCNCRKCIKDFYGVD